MTLTNQHDSTWLKICGLKYHSDVKFCIKSGVDCVGLLVSETRRQHTDQDILSWEDARDIATMVNNTGTEAALLCHSQDLKFLTASISFISPTTVQLQFPYSPKAVWALADANPALNIIQTVRVHPSSKSKDIIEEVTAIERNEQVDAVILDSPRGGSGTAFDWDQAKSVIQCVNSQKIILAGGINPENALMAISTVNPFGVDVMTGARSARGKLDHTKVTQLLAATMKQNS